MESTFIELLKSFGFPVALSVWLLWQGQRAEENRDRLYAQALKENAEAIKAITLAIERMAVKMDEADRRTTRSHARNPE